jgi:hypothetical protein
MTLITNPPGLLKESAVEGIGDFKTKVSDTKHAEGAMVRSPDSGKVDYSLVYRGPMLQRWAELLTRGAINYGADNWLQGLLESDNTIRGRIKKRYKKSAARHFKQWISGDTDEDHAAAVYFNLNGYEAMKWTDDATTRSGRVAELLRMVEDLNG